MDPKTIVELARQKRDPKEQQAFVEGACASNASLRSAVESLLAHPEEISAAPFSSPALVAPMDEHQARMMGCARAVLAPAQLPDEIGRLGNYRVLETLGMGGVGIVFRAEDSLLERQVAIKALLPNNMKDPQFRERMLLEARSIALIESDHVVGLYQVGEDREIFFLVMQLLKGMSLEKWLQKKKQRSLRFLLKIGCEVARGLSAAHALGVVHRDIKPSNIWLEAPRGRVKILDFGIARALSDQTRLTATGHLIGTPAYMSPEQARSEPLDPRSDLFSLGAMLYEACSGCLPFPGNSIMAQLTALAVTPPPALKTLVPNLPDEVAEFIMKLLEKVPGQRPQTAQEVADRFAHLARRVSAETNLVIADEPGGINEALPNLTPVSRDARTEVATPPLRLHAISKTTPSPEPTPADQAPLNQAPLNQAPRPQPARTQTPRAHTSEREPGRKKKSARRPLPWYRQPVLVVVALLVGLIALLVPLLLSRNNNYSSSADSVVASNTNHQAGADPNAGDPTRPRDDNTKPVPHANTIPLALDPRKPVKVFLLAGQSNMAGKGATRTIGYIGSDKEHAWILDKVRPRGKNFAREDVWVHCEMNANEGDIPNTLNGPLQFKYGEGAGRFGPEVMFGHVMGDHFENQVLIIKICQGALALGIEGRPPSSGGQTGSYYLRLVERTRNILQNLSEVLPSYQGQGYELAGFVWFQGWNDHVNPLLLKEYEKNLTNLIGDLRKDLSVPTLPVVIGEFGIDGEQAIRNILILRNAQKNLVNSGKFGNLVVLAPTARFWDHEAHQLYITGGVRFKWHDAEKERRFREIADDFPFLYLGSGKMFLLMGWSMGESMKKALR